MRQETVFKMFIRFALRNYEKTILENHLSVTVQVFVWLKSPRQNILIAVAVSYNGSMTTEPWQWTGLYVQVELTCLERTE